MLDASRSEGAARQSSLLQSRRTNQKQIDFQEENPLDLPSMDEDNAVAGEAPSQPDPSFDSIPDRYSNAKYSNASFEEEDFEPAVRFDNASLLEVARLSKVKESELNKLAGDPGFGDAAAKSAGLLGQFISTGKWDSSMSKDLAGAAWGAASAFVGLSCPVCGLVMGIAWGFFEGLLGDEKDTAANKIYKVVMEQVEVYVTKEFMKDKLETVNQKINTLRNALTRALGAEHLSFVAKRTYWKDLVLSAEALSFGIRSTRHLLDDDFCLVIGPILHTVQILEVYAYTQHEWMMQGESFGDVVRSGEKLRSINRQLLKRINSDVFSYDAVWGKIMPKAKVALKKDMLAVTGYLQTHESCSMRTRKCTISSSLKSTYHGASLYSATGCNRHPRVVCSMGHAGCSWWHASSHCCKLCTERCWKHYSYQNICTDSHYNQFVDSVYTKWLAYQKSHDALEKSIAFGATRQPCLTTGQGGVGAGHHPCVFPFKYRGVRYSTCTKIGHTTEWCATAVDHSGNYVGGHWGNCNSACQPTRQPCLTTGPPCVFPFKYRGVRYSRCTKIGHTTKWCATAVDNSGNYVGGHWGNCNSACQP